MADEYLDPQLERREHDRRFLDELVNSHRRVHEYEEDRDQRWVEYHRREHDNDHNEIESWIKAHADQHAYEQRALDVAIEAEQRRLAAHREAHEAAHAAHEALHLAGQKAHDDAHNADLRAEANAIAAMDKRLESMNQFREQLREQTATFVRVDAFETFREERRRAMESLDANFDKRIDELRALIATEREERRESVGEKKGALDHRAAIFASVGLVGTLLGILIIIMNIWPATPAVLP